MSLHPLLLHKKYDYKITSNQVIEYKNGTLSLAKKLAEFLNDDELTLNKKVTHVNYLRNHFEIQSISETYFANKIVSTIPPRLLVNSIEFNPSLPKYIIRIANKTHTWMGDAIKFGVSYLRLSGKKIIIRELLLVILDLLQSYTTTLMLIISVLY
ncbi:FAD-dependent oxidoreductase [Aquimarina sp. M1]